MSSNAFARRDTCQRVLGMQVVVLGGGDIQVSFRAPSLMLVILAAVAGEVHPASRGPSGAR